MREYFLRSKQVVLEALFVKVVKLQNIILLANQWHDCVIPDGVCGIFSST